MGEIKITNLVKFYTLILLQHKPQHGYEIIKEIQNKTGKPVSSGQIYPFLEKLKKEELIEIKEKGTREKKQYKLTEKGEKFINRMLDRFSDMINIAIEPKLTKCAHCGCQLYKGGYKEKINGKLMSFCCVHCAQTYKKHYD